MAEERTRLRSWPSTYSSPWMYRTKNFSRTGWPWRDWTEAGLSYAYTSPFREEMRDTVGPFPNVIDHDCYHDVYRGRPGRIVGNMAKMHSWRGVVSEEQVHTNTHCGDSGWKFSGSGHLSTHISIYPTDHVNDALSKDSPGEADVDLGEFIGELREWRDLWPRSGAAIPIWFLFAVKPMINDLLAMHNIAESIDRRVKRLNQLTGRTEKERIGLGKAQRSKTSYDHLEGVTWRRHHTTSVRAWAVRTHTIEGDKLKPPKLWNTAETKRLLLSAHPANTIWNLIPWSWFIDYFFGIDAMIKATGNKLPGYKTSSLCVCTEEKSKVTLEQGPMVAGWIDQGIKIHGGNWERTTFRRYIDPSPSARMPSLSYVLSKGQLTNLLALGVAMSDKRDNFKQRAKRWNRRKAKHKAKSGNKSGTAKNKKSS